MKTLLAISPHLDDAMFSAGAYLARRASEGCQVVIVTCFTTSVPDPQGFALACQLDKGLAADVDYMALRRDEDRAACALVGCQPVHLPFAEAPHRGYEDAAALFGQRLPSDTVAGPLSDAIAALVRSLGPDVILGPAAIGGHVDHVIVRSIIEKVEFSDKIFWADLPYAARAQFDRGGFTAERCDPMLPAKLAACRCYASQLAFQFKTTDAMESALQIDGAEWFEPWSG